MRTLAQLIEQRFKALLEVATILGTGQQGPQIKRINHAICQQVRHLIVYDTLGQALGDGGFTNPGLPHQQGIVFTPPRENLRNSLNF